MYVLNICLKGFLYSHTLGKGQFSHFSLICFKPMLKIKLGRPRGRPPKVGLTDGNQTRKRKKKERSISSSRSRSGKSSSSTTSEGAPPKNIEKLIKKKPNKVPGRPRGRPPTKHLHVNPEVDDEKLIFKKLWGDHSIDEEKTI